MYQIGIVSNPRMEDETFNELDFYYCWVPLATEEFEALREGDEAYFQTPSGLQKGRFWGFHFRSKSGDPRYLVLIGNRSHLVSSTDFGKLRSKPLSPLNEAEFLGLRPGDKVVYLGPPILGGIPSRRYRGEFVRFQTEKELLHLALYQFGSPGNVPKAALEEKKRVPAAVLTFIRGRQIFVDHKWIRKYPENACSENSHGPD